MKNLRFKTSKGISLALSNLCDTCSTTAIEDAVADSKTGAELVRKLNSIKGLYRNNFTLDRETDTMVRLKTVDCFGNVDYLEATKEEPKEKQLVATITDAINGMFDPKGFCEAMSKEHRYLQYEFTNLCLNWLKQCRNMYNEGRYDGRNEHACLMGKAIWDYIDSDKFMKE